MSFLFAVLLKRRVIGMERKVQKKMVVKRFCG